MASSVVAEDTTIAARDNFRLAATVFQSEAAPRRVAIINSAIAVPRQIYREFASYLSERSFVVLTYDYRGVAGSRPPSLRRFSAKMRDWAELDAAAVIDYAVAKWPQLPLVVIGHSFGGQAVGLAPNNDKISSALLIAANAGYWGLMTAPERYRIHLLFRFVLPPIAWIAGYVPAKKLGLGEDIPYEVFTEWASWIMKDKYFFDDPTLHAIENFQKYRGRLRAVGFADDCWATDSAIALLMTGFSSARVERQQIRPSELNKPSIGHFGFFRSENRDVLWHEPVDWLSL